MNRNGKKYQNRAFSSKNSLPKLSLPQGLPNIGNICFLNSILQQFFRLEKVKEQLINHIAQYEESSLLGQIGKLFVSLKNQDSFKLKEAKLREMQKSLQTILLDYEISCQYDSFETFLAILNEIIESKNELSSLFEIQYTLNCQCSQEMFFTQWTIESQRKRCSGCEKFLKRNIIKFPQYLICHGINSESIELLADDTIQKNMKFNLLSKNIYIGNKESGHYYSVCYINQKAYKFDDKIVSEYDENKTKKNQECVFSIYQISETKGLKISPKEIKRSSHSNKGKNKKNIKSNKLTPDQTNQRIVFVKQESNVCEQFKNDERIYKAHYIPQKLIVGQTQQIESSSLPMQSRFTYFVLLANFIHRIFELVSNRLKTSFKPLYIFPQAPIWSRCTNYSKNTRILSSIGNIFMRIRCPVSQEREQSMLLT